MERQQTPGKDGDNSDSAVTYRNSDINSDSNSDSAVTYRNSDSAVTYRNSDSAVTYRNSDINSDSNSDSDSDNWDAKLAPLSGKLSTVLDTLVNFMRKHQILPQPKEVFEIFRMIKPSGVRAVFIGQSPYPGLCPKTGIPYACGPAFMPREGCASIPLSLRVMMTELCSDLEISRLQVSPRSVIAGWIAQGVMLLNASLTIGYNCPDDIKDHSLVWEEFMRGVVSVIAKRRPVFVLIGREAWKFETCLYGCPKVLVSHPAARGTAKLPWLGSRVFTRVSRILESLDRPEIRWA